MQHLSWGQKALMVRPVGFDVFYSINPYMDPSVEVDSSEAMRQWEELAGALEQAGCRVDVAQGDPKLPDMVYAMNLGYATADRRVLLSSMAHPERRGERNHARAAFEKLGFWTDTLPEGLGNFEAGDVFPLGDDVLAVGVGPRTSMASAYAVAEWAERELLALPCATNLAYHLDLSFMPLPGKLALVHPQAWSVEGWDALRPHLRDYLVLTREEAFTAFAANSIVVNDTVIVPAGLTGGVAEWLREQGFKVVTVDVSEFHKGGGSIRCMVNTLDFPAAR